MHLSQSLNLNIHLNIQHKISLTEICCIACVLNEVMVCGFSFFFCSRISSSYLSAKQNHTEFISWIMNILIMWAHNFSLNLSKWKFCENTCNLYVGFFFCIFKQKTDQGFKNIRGQCWEVWDHWSTLQSHESLGIHLQVHCALQDIVQPVSTGSASASTANNAPKLPTFYSPSVKIADFRSNFIYCTILEVLEAVRSYFRSRVLPL